MGFKVFDSSEDGQARFSLHASFDDAATAASAPERESVELRCIVFFDDVPEQFGSSFVAPHLAPGSPDRIDVSPKVVITDKEKAEKLKQSLPPGLQVKELK